MTCTGLLPLDFFLGRPITVLSAPLGLQLFRILLGDLILVTLWMQSDCDKCFTSLYHSSNTTPGNLLITLFHTHTQYTYYTQTSTHTTHTVLP